MMEIVYARQDHGRPCMPANFQYVMMRLLNKVLRFSVPAMMAFTELHRFLQLHYCCLTNVIEYDGSCLRTSRSWKTLHACQLPYESYVVMQLLNKVLRFSVPAMMAFTELHRFLQLHHCCLTNVIES